MPPRRGTINFTGGPSKIPETVLRRAQQEMVDFEDTGISVLEVDHHSVEFINFTKRLEEKITNLLKIPNNYTLLFMPGCIETQYEAIALNLGRLIKGTISANYLMTGYSSEAAYAAACKYFTPYVVNPDIQPYTNIPSLNELKLRPNSSYFFYVAADAVTGETRLLKEQDI
uniref:Aminotran_5 domain-containing protein n=1 Tax=Rhabditophanes sp. KR3021 TaxID=114890 RepID=A0AC35U1D2_9BILA